VSVAAQQRIFTNRERTVLVTIWPSAAYPFEVVEVALRDEPGEVWGPPVTVEEERRLP
jgi:hypothetical protein